MNYKVDKGNCRSGAGVWMSRRGLRKPNGADGLTPSERDIRDAVIQNSTFRHRMTLSFGRENVFIDQKSLNDFFGSPDGWRIRLARGVLFDKKIPSENMVADMTQEEIR